MFDKLKRALKRWNDRPLFKSPEDDGVLPSSNEFVEYIPSLCPVCKGERTIFRKPDIMVFGFEEPATRYPCKRCKGRGFILHTHIKEKS